jgi:hypothetical protein
MECPSCTFQNTPGTRTCVRCSTLLDLAAVEFIPPRASSGRAGRRARAAAQAARFSLVSGLADVGRALHLPETAGVPWSQVFLAIVPGLPQIRASSPGLRFLGFTILGSWVLVLLLALAFIGTGFATLLSFASISIHCFSISLVLNPLLQGTNLLYRLLAGISIYITVLFCLYWPASHGLRQIAHVLPVNGIRKQRVIANDDVLLYTGGWTRPSHWERGDLVVASIGPATFGHAYVQPGLNVDRIVAVPGDSVKLFKGVLTVNGETPSSDLGPIGPTASLPDAEFEVAPASYVILPSALPWMNPGNIGPARDSMLAGLVMVPEESIQGRVIMRVRPWSRAGYPKGPHS